MLAREFLSLAAVLFASCHSTPRTEESTLPSIPSAPVVAWTVPGGGSSLPALGKDHLCVAGPELKLIDPATGEVLATRSPSDQERWFRVEPLQDGTWIAASAHEITRLSARLDRVLWRADSEGMGWFSVAPGRGLVGVVLRRGMKALDLETGEERWQHSYSGTIQHSPANDGAHFFFGTTAGSFLAIACEDGEVLWRDERPTQYGWSDPVVAGDLVLVADRGIGGSMNPRDTGASSDDVEGPRAGAINAFRIADGTRVWSTIFGATGFSRPFVETGAGLVWAGFGHSVLPFELATGKMRRELTIRTGSNAFGSPRVIGDRVAFGNLDGHFYVHARNGGELAWSVSNGGGQVYAWVAREGRLFVQMSRRLVCLQQNPNRGTVAAGMVIQLEPSQVAATAVPRPAKTTEARSAPRERPLNHRAAWVKGMHALGKSGARERGDALAAIRASLAGEKASERRDALAALQASGDVTFDKEAFRPRILELAGRGDVEDRLAALGTLAAFGPEPGDIRLVLDAYDLLRGRERARITWFLAVFSSMNLREGRAAEVLLELARDPLGTGFENEMNGIWGCRVSDEVTDALIEISRSGGSELRGRAIYFGLSTFEDKNKACVDRLVEVLADPDWNNSGRALWGLGFGVPEESRGRVVDGLLDLYANRSSASVRQQAERILRDYGAGDRLDAIIAGEDESD